MSDYRFWSCRLYCCYLCRSCQPFSGTLWRITAGWSVDNNYRCGELSRLSGGCQWPAIDGWFTQTGRAFRCRPAFWYCNRFWLECGSIQSNDWRREGDWNWYVDNCYGRYSQIFGIGWWKEICRYGCQCLRYLWWFLLSQEGGSSGRWRWYGLWRGCLPGRTG